MNYAAGEVLPGLWVGSLMSVYYLTRLIQHSNENKEVVMTVISVLSNPNLVSMTTQALEEQRRILLNDDKLITSINHAVIPLKDTVNSDLKSILPNAMSAIDEALFDHHRCSDNEDCHHNSQTRICLVHCAKGESAYLLTRHSHSFTTFEEALRHIRTVRPQALPNVGFSVILRQLERLNH